MSHKQETRFSVEGNNGGSYVTLTKTDRENVVRLEVGHNCVTVCDQEINVFVLAEILFQAKVKGFGTVAREAFDGEDIPKWALPI